MNKISAIIVVKNNPPHLIETINSINGLVEEIIIGNIDIREDLKKNLTLNKKVRLVNIAKQTPFADFVKEDLKKETKGNYILYLDPDEIFPEAIKTFLTENLEKYDFYNFPRKNIIFGKWIMHSRWWPDHQLRLFRKNSVVWPKSIHPIVKPKGKGFTFNDEEKNSIIHYNYDNLDQYLEKAIRYAKSEAATKIQNKEEYTLASAIKQATSEFISRFFAHEGYKDRMHGFSLAVLQMFYYFLVYFYYWEGKKYFSVDQKQLLNYSRNYFKESLKEINYWLVKKKLAKSLRRIKLKLENIALKVLK